METPTPLYNLFPKPLQIQAERENVNVTIYFPQQARFCRLMTSTVQRLAETPVRLLNALIEGSLMKENPTQCQRSRVGDSSKRSKEHMQALTLQYSS